MTTPEALCKKHIRVILAEEDVYYAMPVGSGYGNSGVPDFLCCVNGRFLAVEAKAGKGKTTALQDKHIEEIERCKGKTLVMYDTLDHMKELRGLIRWMKSLSSV